MPLNIQQKATDEAFQFNTRLLVALLLSPLMILGFQVASADAWIQLQLATCVSLAIVSFVVVERMVPEVAEKLIAKLFGVDIGKRGLHGPHDGEKVPESLGIVSATVFMVVIGLLELLFGKMNNQLNAYNAALLSICFAALLGLVDDVIDIKWRHKVPVTALMSLPLLLSYTGTTAVLIPAPMSAYFQEGSFLNGFLNVMPTMHVYPDGKLLELGFVFYGYMLALVIFCTNSINIYAGINGLEVGQSIVTAVGISISNLLDLRWRGGSQADILSGDGKNHLFSLMIMIPFIATSFGLLKFNFYPAKVFVGDVYPYYAGMTFAVAAILGHFSKTLLLFMLPQLLNFIYSLPQLFHIVPCPRHRLPRINLKTGFVEASTVAPDDARTNMTLLCFALRIFGPMHERTLCVVLLGFQAICAIFAILVRLIIIQYFTID